ncbi:hypothetical protein BDC45DRAFT_527190, partial [Circinella umbellata]
SNHYSFWISLHYYYCYYYLMVLIILFLIQNIRLHLLCYCNNCLYYYCLDNAIVVKFVIQVKEYVSVFLLLLESGGGVLLLQFLSHFLEHLNLMVPISWVAMPMEPLQEVKPNSLEVSK